MGSGGLPHTGNYGLGMHPGDFALNPLGLGIGILAGAAHSAQGAVPAGLKIS